VKLRIETTAMDALMVRLFDTIDETNMAWVIAANQALRNAFGPALIDLVPSYTTLLVHYDCQQLNHVEAHGLINKALCGLTPADTQAGELHDIPVWYDESVGPELSIVSKRAGLSVDALVEQHCHHDYCVFALGFAPGYGFMGLVDEALATPRLKTPRRNVAAGSVGIADRQTAIYPLLSPGGWISKCGLASILPSCENAYLQMGDDGVLSLLDSDGELEWKIDGAVCKSDECTHGLEMKEDSHIAIGGKKIQWVNVKKDADDISPWPFAEEPNLKVIHARK
jgi:KipI family sensor histidine kinase inhibitor